MMTIKDIHIIIFDTFIDCYCHVGASLTGVRMCNISTIMLFEGDY